MKTTDERPHLEEGCRDAAYLRFVVCGLSWHIGNQIHIPLHRSQKASEALCDLCSRLRSRFHRTPLQQSQATFPFPSGHILLGRRINRSDPRRPAVPKRVVEFQQGVGSESTGRSRRQSPSGPSTPKVTTSPKHPTGIGPHGRQGSGSRGSGRASRPQSRGIRRPSPSHAFAESRAQPSDSTAGPQPSRFPVSTLFSTKPHQPPDQTPLDCSHLVSAHPPCSRKGPLLPACGLKCPRRVKRETTNSRFFCALRGLGQNFAGQVPKKCECQTAATRLGRRGSAGRPGRVRSDSRPTGPWRAE